jgi:hypothetical protein
VVVALAAFGAPSCGRDLPPYGQVLVVVDTDLPAPAVANVLRVDLYAEDGTWTESTEFPRPNAGEWPASFTLYSEEPARSLHTLVRLRAYPAGRVRDYLGERFAPRPIYTAPFVAHSAAELCASPPVLALGTTMLARRGRYPILDGFEGPGCDGTANAVGSVAAAFDIATAGSYRVGVLDTLSTAGVDVSIEVRHACGDPVGLACAPGDGAHPTTQLTLDLQPGPYVLVTGGRVLGIFSARGADLIVGVAEASAWPPALPSEPEIPPPSTGPRLLRGAADATPTSEPAPATAVDRLALLEVSPSTFGAARLTLHGACAGTMARIGSASAPDAVSIAGAGTCDDGTGFLGTVAAAPVDGARSPSPTSEAGTFLAEACPPASSQDPVACVPGGSFLLGSIDSGFPLVDGPERIAGLHRFWMDRFEVTFAEWRKALAGGLVLRPGDAPISGTPQDTLCLDPGSAPDAYGIQCIPWEGARAFCRFRGGDLPTEAQWEYVATAVGRPSKTRYPWGDDPPKCTCAGEPSPCHAPLSYRAMGYCFSSAPPYAPGTFDEPNGDVVPGVGVVGLLTGSWTRDAFESFSSPCWQAAASVDPACLSDDAPEHTGRSFRFPQAPGPSRGWPESLGRGFRCVYTEHP